MHSVEGSLLRSRNSVGSENDIASGRERASRRESGEINRKQMRGSNGAECIQSEKAMESEVKATWSKSKQKRTIKRKRRRELYDGDTILCTTDYLQCSTMPGVTTTDYPLYSTCLYVYITTDYPLYSVWRYTTTNYPMYSTLSVNSTSDYPICRLSILQSTIRSALSSDTATDYPLCSALLCLLILQATIRSTDYSL
jgi:hypothetical protein